jgi:hypothetical protein
MGIKLTNVRWTRHVTHGETRNSYFKRRSHLDDLAIDGRILTWILNKDGLSIQTG